MFPNTLSLLVDNWPTPLVRLETESHGGKEVWAKLECYNPFSKSIKDRAVWGMVLKMLEKRSLTEVVMEATSGNVGLSLLSICNILGLKFTAFILSTTPRATETLLKTFGANVIRTNYETINQEFWREVQEYAESAGAINLNQFENDANFEIHYNTTAVEILKQLESIGRKPDYVFAGIGTSGHIVAITKRIRERYGGNVRVIGVQPARGCSIPGIKRVETKPKWIRCVSVDEVVDVSRAEAIEGTIDLAIREGICWFELWSSLFSLQEESRY